MPRPRLKPRDEVEREELNSRGRAGDGDAGERAIGLRRCRLKFEMPDRRCDPRQHSDSGRWRPDPRPAHGRHTNWGRLTRRARGRGALDVSHRGEARANSRSSTRIGYAHSIPWPAPGTVTLLPRPPIRQITKKRFRRKSFAPRKAKPARRRIRPARRPNPQQGPPINAKKLPRRKNSGQKKLTNGRKKIVGRLDGQIGDPSDAVRPRHNDRRKTCKKMFPHVARNRVERAPECDATPKPILKSEHARHEELRGPAPV